MFPLKHKVEKGFAAEISNINCRKKKWMTLPIVQKRSQNTPNEGFGSCSVGIFEVELLIVLREA